MRRSIFSGRSPLSRLPSGQQWSSNWIVIALLLLITASATALRLYRLDAKGLWVDEIFTAIFASADNDLAATVRKPLSSPIPTPPLWFFITHFFVKALGSSDAIVRLPSVIAGVLGVLVIYKVGEMLFDRTIGLISAFLLAISPMHLHHSQEARFYAGIVLLSLLTLYFLYRGVNSNEKKWWAGFTIATLANLYTHLTAFLVLTVEVLYACLLLMHKLVATRRTGATRHLRATFAMPLLISLGIIIVCYAPMMPYLLRGMQGPRGLGNPYQIEGLSLSVRYFIFLFGDFGAGAGIALSLYIAAFLWGLINAIRKQRWQGLLIVLWSIIPFAIVFLLRPKHWFAPKYVIFILPLYLMTVSLGITSIARSIADFLGQWNILCPPRFLQALSLISLVTIYGLMSVSGLDDVYAWQNDRWKIIGQLLTSNMEPEDAVVPVPLIILTMSAQDIMAYYGPTSEEVDVVTVSSRSQMEDILTNHRRVWIVIDRRADLNKSREIVEWLAPQPYVELSVGNETKVLYTGKDQTQLALLEEAKHFTNLTADAYGSIAEAYCSLGMWEEAQAAYAQAVRMEPDRGIWHHKLAALCEGQEQHGKALAEYQWATRLQFETSSLHAFLRDFYPHESEISEERVEVADNPP